MPRITAVTTLAVLTLGTGTAVAAGPQVDPFTSLTNREDVSGQTIVKTEAAKGYVNRLRYERSGQYLVVTDGAAGAGAKDTSCTGADARPQAAAVYCDPTGVDRMFARLGNFDDSAINTTGLQMYAFGGAGNDQLLGGTEYDFLNGDEDADVLEGREGGDVLVGGDGDDLLDGGPGRDQLSPGDGTDILRAGDGDDELLFGDGPDDFHGGEGRDGISYQFFDQPVTITLDDVANDGAVGEGDNVHSDIERVLGGDVADRITGNDEPNTLDGLSGADVLIGGGGADDLEGGYDNDDLRGGDGPDQLSGGTGTDTLEGEDDDDVLVDHAPDDPDSFRGGDGIDTASYASRDRAVAVSLDDVANDGVPGEGDDVRTDVEHVITGEGDDTISGSALANTLAAGPGSDVVDGGAGRDAIDAGTGNDSIRARDGEIDTITCGAGDDTVVADRDDVVAADCERVQRPATATPRPRACTSPRITTRSTRMSATTGRARLTVRARGGARCAAVLTLKRSGRLAGRQTLTLTPGSARTVFVLLSTPLRQKIAERGSVRVSARVRTTDPKRGARGAQRTIRIRR